MENKVFKLFNRRLMIKSFLKDHGSLSLEEMRARLRKENKIIPLFDMPDSEVDEWLGTINGIIRMNSNGVIKYSVAQFDPSLRVNDENHISNRQMIDRHDDNGNTSTADNLTLKSFGNIQNKQSSSTPKQTKHNNYNIQKRVSLGQHEVPHLFDLPIYADDQMLNIALFDLKFSKNPNFRRRQSGNCVSGLRIKEATRRLFNFTSESGFRKIIVNVGSVDIIENRPLIGMIKDMMEFLRVCDEMEIRPILTTLTPLPNCTNDEKDVLIGFNDFIMKQLSQRYFVIDLHTCMLTSKGSINMNFYQNDPRRISGSRKLFVMWNKFGRQLILKRVVDLLGNAIVYDNNNVKVKCC